MKKLFLLVVFVIGAGLTTQAQTIADNAIGLRFGGGDGLGAEVSYQRALGMNNNRLELDLGWRNDSSFDAFKLAAIYQWVWNIEAGFNWYAGVGGGVGSVEDKRRLERRGNDGTFLFLAGNVGIEYNFDIPLLISLDFRPEFGFNDYDVLNEFSPDVALGVRYQF
ncbi:hypothetical protein FHG64_01145 [Antarcticibacterium flavum]|uniref:Porin family protein n=1 Tax=Antarcticibacterium flavum TaxID=2058175 RepID=A0A5B7WY34_9FLAO|nr:MULTISPECIES: hypothetical protein [Antarcticibacterium]MCM4158853.1 hypothetical protein [Antarcticibacterium sp. W02-3]QCY68114.1 hypothetical protein FHG64_01145 [Antarcticibacterium flavum]